MCNSDNTINCNKLRVKFNFTINKSIIRICLTLYYNGNEIGTLCFDCHIYDIRILILPFENSGLVTSYSPTNNNVLTFNELTFTIRHFSLRRISNNEYMLDYTIAINSTECIGSERQTF